MSAIFMALAWGCLHRKTKLHGGDSAQRFLKSLSVFSGDSADMVRVKMNSKPTFNIARWFCDVLLLKIQLKVRVFIGKANIVNIAMNMGAAELVWNRAKVFLCQCSILCDVVIDFFIRKCLIMTSQSLMLWYDFYFTFFNFF